ncbi:protocadherin Fat 4, partial [Biomphalaria pfeifferi]
IAELRQQTGHQIIVSYTPTTTLSGNYSLIWQLQYGSYVESCLLNFGKPVDECSSSTNPCFNGSTCKDLEVGYNCACSSGFFGYVCDHGAEKFCSISSSLIVLSTINKSADVILSCQNLNFSTNRTPVEGTLLGDLLKFNGSVLNETTLIMTFTLATYKPGVQNLVEAFSALGGGNHRLITFFIYNPPNFPSDFVKITISKNVTVGMNIFNMKANTDNLPTMLNYSVTDSDKDTSMAYYFSIDQNGMLQVRRPIPINVFPVFNITLQVTDSMTHQFDSSIVEVSIENINKPPQCTTLKVPSVYISVSNATFSLLNCTDPEGIEQFINFKFTVTAAPPSITVSVNQNGTFTIVNRVPNNITSFYLNITVQNNEFEQYFNFTVPVINDYPYCNISKTVLLLSQTNLSDHLHVTCDTIDPGNVHNMTFTGADGMPTLNALRFSISQKDNSTMSFNISFSNYLPNTYNVTLNVIVNGFLRTEQITVFVYNPPAFTSHFYNITVYQNVSVGSNISLLQATTESLAPLVYSFTQNSIDSDGSYLTINSLTGIVSVIQPIPNNLVSFNLTIQVKDTLTNQSDTAILQVTILDTNEPPVCTVASSVQSVYISSSNVILGFINCTDPDRDINFTTLNYTVTAEPSTVSVTIDHSGLVNLTDKVPQNVTSFNITVKVEDFSYTVFAIFSVAVVNVSSCNFSPAVLALWETSTTRQIEVICEPSDSSQFQKLIVSEIQFRPVNVFFFSIALNNKSINVTLLRYNASIYTMTVNLSVNSLPVTNEITIYVFNPPKFSSQYVPLTVSQNVTAGERIWNASIVTDQVLSALKFYLNSSALGINPSSYFTVDSKGNLQAAQPFPNSLVSTFNLTLQVIDTQTNQSDVSIIQVTVVDINEPPDCTLNYVPSVNMSSLFNNSNTSIAIINCTDPDINDNFQRLNYSVQTVPSSVQVTIDVNGYVRLANNMPNNTTSFQVFVTVRDMEFEKHFEFKINVTNDLPPSCMPSKNVIVLWETHRSESINVTCDISNPATMYNLSYQSYIDCPDILSPFITKTSLNVLVANISLLKYNASKCNITFQISNSLIVTGKSTVQNVTVLVYNPPKFTNATAHILQNISRDSYILNVSATSDSLQPLQYSLVNSTANGLEADVYFTINQRGIILSVSDIPNSLVGSLNLTIKARDTLTNLSSLALFTVVIEDVNEPPNCAIVNIKPINSSTPSKSNLSQVSCHDSDVTPAFTKLTYKVKAEPDLVNITENGDIYLLNTIPASVKTINITVNISDISTVVLVNYIHVITDYSCEEKQEQGVTFNYTLAGSNVTAACPVNYEGYILRFCNENKTWEDFSFINCVRQSLKTITNKTKEIVANQESFTTEEIKQQILDIVVDLNSTFTNQVPGLSGDIKQTVNVLQDISTLVEKSNVTVSDDILHKIATISNTLLSAHQDIWTDLLNQYQTTGSAIIYLVDFFSNNSLSTITNDSLILTSTLDIVRAISVDDIVFPKPNDPANSNDWTTKLFLSKEAFSGAGEIKYAVVHYKDVVDKFQINKTLQNLFNETAFLNLASTIITFSVLRTETIQKDLKLSFQVKNISRNLKANCGFLNTAFSTFNELGLWSSYGCTLESSINNTFDCSCNHLTNFAILMSTFELEPESSLALSIISTIGCGISIFCLVVTIIVYLVVWKHVKGDRSLLHLNLCVCLIICYILFLAGVDRREDEVGCKVVAVLMHFFYLAVFLTMFAEGIQICKAVVFVFKKESIIHILFPFIYGIPLVIVAISLGATKTEGYISENYCWLSVHKGLIWAFVGPVLFVLLSNFIILIITLRVMQSTAVHRLKSKSEKLKSVVRTIYMLSPILGLTWIFGVLSVNSDLVVFQYLFAICNSLQGLFVFLCYCVLSHQIREGISKMRKHGHSKSFDSGVRGTDSSAKNDSETKTLRLGSSSSQEEEMNVLSIPPIRKNLAFTNIRYGANE